MLSGAACCQLVRLREGLPEERVPFSAEHGTIIIGRRPNCTVVLKDAAVSGTHCIVTRSCAGDRLAFEVEDRSTNGTYVNGKKLTKGQRLQLVEGGVLSLTRPGDRDCLSVGESQVAPCIEFRLEVTTAVEAVADHKPSYGQNGYADAVAVEDARPESQLVAPAIEEAPAVVEANVSVAPGFTRDLLVQEQQSKAKITGELLLLRRRLEEERTRTEALRRELRKAQAAMDDERGRRGSAQEDQSRIQVSGNKLRNERMRLEEVRAAHQALLGRHDSLEVDLGAQQQRAVSLEAARERLAGDLQRALAETSRSEAKLTEAQSRWQLLQDRLRKLQDRHSELQKEADAANCEAERLQVDVSTQRAEREEQEDKLTLLRADIERAERGAEAAENALAAISTQQAEIQRIVESHHTDAESARSGMQHTLQCLSKENEIAESLRRAGGGFAESLRRFAYTWGRNLSEDSGGGDSVRPTCGIVVTTTLRTAATLVDVPPAEVPTSTGRQLRPPQLASAKPDESAAAALETLPGSRPAAAGRENTSSEVVLDHVPATAALMPPPPVPPQRAVTATSVPAPNVSARAARDCLAALAGGSFRPVQNVLSLMVSSQDTVPLPAAPCGEDERNCTAGVAKRTVTESILGIPGFESAAKRARPPAASI